MYGNKVHHITLILFYAISALGAEEQDRKDKYDKSRDEARRTNQQNLQPNMMGHLGKAMEHMKQAEEARKQQNEGKAKQEEQMAMMEQNKAQQLKQQMQENEKSAKANDEGSKKLSETTDKMPPIAKGDETKVITVRDFDKKGKDETMAKDEAAAEPPIPKNELINLGAVAFVPTSIKPAASVMPEPGAAERSRFGYDESLPVTSANSKNGPPPAAGTSSTSSAGPSSAKADAPPATGLAALSGATIVGGGGGGASSAKNPEGGDFWSSLGQKVDSENREFIKAEERLNMKNLRGIVGDKKKDEDADGDKLPSSKLSDVAFWKKVGKEPAKCKVDSAYQRNKCLKSTRRQYERQWRETQNRPKGELRAEK